MKNAHSFTKLNILRRKIGLVTQLVIPCRNLPKRVFGQVPIDSKLELLEPLQKCPHSLRCVLLVNIGIQRQIFERQPVQVRVVQVFSGMLFTIARIATLIGSGRVSQRVISSTRSGGILGSALDFALFCSESAYSSGFSGDVRVLLRPLSFPPLFFNHLSLFHNLYKIPSIKSGGLFRSYFLEGVEDSSCFLRASLRLASRGLFLGSSASNRVRWKACVKKSFSFSANSACWVW